MCGIAGIMTADGSPPSEPALERLADALAHRGPDGRGRHMADGVGMVQTRLAIIDLETGDQPIYAPAGAADAAAIVANAEIYNYVELRADLAGAEFTTRSDCEPALHLYLRHGLDFTGLLRGMYAIAIHDRARNRLVLARDPFGIKPLYYTESAGRFAFASEPQALLKADLAVRALRTESRDELFQLQFTCGRRTAFKGIQRLLPGETIVVERGHVVKRRRRKALPDGAPETWGAAEAGRRLADALTDSVTVHQRSDVPYGMFLSGGVDSSALLALMRELNDEPVHAFCAGFSAPGVADERDHARVVAEAAGARFEAVEFAEDDFWRLLPAIAAAMDDPAADYALLPSYKLARLAREAGLKVILTGEGGDELFAGYGRYRRNARWRLFGGRPMRARGAFDGMDVLRTYPGNWRAGIGVAEVAENRPGRTRLQVAQAVDCTDWLPHDLLAKLDRCLMAHGVEGRTPFLDPRVAEVAFRLPDRLKVRLGLGKWLLRSFVKRRLPSARPFSRKRGFTVPVAGWIAGRGRDLGPLVARQPGVREACRPGAVEDLFAGSGKRQGRAAWNLLFFALWHRVHILGLAAEGDVFETLASET